MSGRLIGVVGPSGVGKDTVMQAVVAARPGIGLVRRVITRAPDAGGEVYNAVSEAEFDRRVIGGDFALHWQAHGLRYGIPRGVEDDLASGRTMLVNLSRSVLREAQARFARFTVLSLTARTEVLAARLAGRGRETREDIARRLDRAGYGLPEGLRDVVHIDNSGGLDDTVGAVLAAIPATEEVME